MSGRPSTGIDNVCAGFTVVLLWARYILESYASASTASIIGFVG